MINLLIRIYYFIFDRIFSPAVWWLAAQVSWFDLLAPGGIKPITADWFKPPRKEQSEEEVVAQDRVYFYIPGTGRWFEGIYMEESEYTITFLTDEGVMKQLPKIYEESNEEPIEEEEPCPRCGGDGYIQLSEEEFEACSSECVKQAEEEKAAIDERHAKQQLEAWLRSECPRCKKLQRDCQCTDIGF